MTTKKQLVARGIAGALSLCGVLGMVACGAETGDQGAAGEGEIGASEQALNLTLTSSGYKAKFSAAIALDSSHLLVTGGYNDTNGNAISTSKIYDSVNDTWVQAGLDGANPDTFMTARGEHGIALIPNTDKVLVFGGRDDDTGNFLSSADIYDISDDKWTAVTNSMVTGVSNLAVAPCGNAANSELLVFGGLAAGPAASNGMQVFTFVPGMSGDGAGSTWASLKDNAGVPATLNLATARAKHQVVPFSTTEFFVIGGESAGATATSSTELVTTSTACDAATKASKANLPAARSRFAAAFVTDDNTDGAEFKAIVAGGTTNGTNVQSTVYIYDKTANSWGTLTNSLSASRALLTMTERGAGTNVFDIVGGHDASAANSSNVVNKLTLPNPPTATGGTYVNSTLKDARFGHVAAFLSVSGGGSDTIVSHGVKQVASPLSTTFIQTPE